MSEVTKKDVLYFPPEMIGAREGAHCGVCRLMIENGLRCMVMRATVSAEKGVCGLYVHGTPQKDGKSGVLSPEVAGYTEDGPTHCDNCEYGPGKAVGRCQKASGIGIVEANGCCDAWEKRPTPKMIALLTKG